MADIANFLAQNSPRYNRAAIDREHFGNALMRNEVERLPQRNRAEDVAMAADEHSINESQRQTAAGLLATRFAAGAQSQSPKAFAAQFLSDPNFQAAGKLLGLPVEQFTVTDQDTDDALRQSMTEWAAALGQGGQAKVQSTQVLEDGTIAYMTSDGQLVRTPERARNPMQIVPGGVGGAPALVDRTNARVTPISTPEAETQAAANRASATTTATTTAQAEAEMGNAQRANQRTLGVWNVAREGLIKALSGTTTGPVAGRLPAVTSGQQIADGAVAAVAPVLKQLFRSAGEGVFTDRDQQLLIDMIPNREDHPETRVAKMQMIDAIIQAKLAAGSSSPQGVTSFATEAEAAAAGLAPGTRITIGGVSGVWQ